MTVAAALVLMGVSVTTKAASLLKSSSDVSITQDNDEGLVLRHASELFGDNDMSLTGHSSHSSHRSHSSHSSHRSHSSHYSSR